MEPGMKKQLKRGLHVFLLASFALHIFFWAGINFSSFFTTPVPARQYIEFEIADSTKDKLQVIEQTKKAINDEVPEETKYLGRHNQRVIKETKAANHGDLRNTAGKGENKSKKQSATASKVKAPEITPHQKPSSFQL